MFERRIKEKKERMSNPEDTNVNSQPCHAWSTVYGGCSVSLATEEPIKTLPEREYRSSMCVTHPGCDQFGWIGIYQLPITPILDQVA